MLDRHCTPEIQNILDDWLITTKRSLFHQKEPWFNWLHLLSLGHRSAVLDCTFSQSCLYTCVHLSRTFYSIDHKVHHRYHICHLKDFFSSDESDQHNRVLTIAIPLMSHSATVHFHMSRIRTTFFECRIDQPGWTSSDWIKEISMGIDRWQRWANQTEEYQIGHDDQMTSELKGINVKSERENEYCIGLGRFKFESLALDSIQGDQFQFERLNHHHHHTKWKRRSTFS